MTDPVETLMISHNSHEEDFVTVIEEDNIPTSEPEENMPVHTIPDEVESMNPKENLDKFSEFTYHKKDATTDTPAYDKLFNAIKKIDTLYKPSLPRVHKPVI